MNPISFLQANRRLMPPEGMTDCDPMDVFATSESCMSVWQMSKDEIAALNRNDGKVYVWVIGGDNQPPISLAVRDPFVSNEPDVAERGTGLVVGLAGDRVVFQCPELLGGTLAMTPDVATALGEALIAASNDQREAREAREASEARVSHEARSIRALDRIFGRS